MRTGLYFSPLLSETLGFPGRDGSLSLYTPSETAHVFPLTSLPSVYVLRTPQAYPPIRPSSLGPGEAVGVLCFLTSEPPQGYHLRLHLNQGCVRCLSWNSQDIGEILVLQLPGDAGSLETFQRVTVYHPDGCDS